MALPLDEVFPSTERALMAPGGVIEADVVLPVVRSSLAYMLTGVNHNQILQFIVKAVPVYMVNMLGTFKGAPQLLFHQVAMLLRPPPSTQGYVASFDFPIDPAILAAGYLAACPYGIAVHMRDANTSEEGCGWRPLALFEKSLLGFAHFCKTFWTQFVPWFERARCLQTLHYTSPQLDYRRVR